MNNAVHGKSIENLRKRIDARLPSNKNDYLKWIQWSSCISQKIFDNDLVAILKSKVPLMFNKPSYVGMCVLDILE